MHSNEGIKMMKSMWIAVVATGLLGFANSQPRQIEFVPGQIVLTAKPGVLLTTVRQIASTVGAEAKPILCQDTYLLTLPAGGSDAAAMRQRTLTAVESLRAHQQVWLVRPNYLDRPLDTVPNDPRYPDQWALPMINAPQAWDIELGDAAVKVGVIDTNFRSTHPDMVGRYDTTLSRNFVAEPPDNNIDPGGGGSSHGTGVASVIVANANNGIGMAGLCWENVQVVAMKTNNNDGGLPFSNILQAYQHVNDNVAVIDAVNMSYGGFRPPDQQEEGFFQNWIQNGCVPVAAAGNDNTDSRSFQPAGSDRVITVAAVGPTMNKASYSNYGKIDLAAPGGDMQNALNQGVLVATPQGDYEFTQGTSFASPYVAAAVGLLRSAGVPRTVRRAPNGRDFPEAAVVLMETANSLGRRVPDPEFGSGLIDMFAGIKGAGAFCVIDAPINGRTFDTLRNRVTMHFGGTAPDLITITLNGNNLPTSEWQPLLVPDQQDPGRFDLSYVKQFSTGRQELSARVVSTVDPTVTASASTVFFVSPHKVIAGLDIFATPYGVPAAPEETLGVDFAMARWITDPQHPNGGFYARYFGDGEKDARASFAPPGTDVRPDGETIPTPPRGLGYFLSLNNDIVIQAMDPIELTQAYRIPLTPGWNMIGNPFPFDVDWNGCEVEIIGDGAIPQRLSLIQAADQGYVRLQIYRYLPFEGDYTWKTAPLGEMLRWSGHWVRALKACTLVVPPLASRSRSVAGRAAPSLSEGWAMRLTASTADRSSANVFIGASRQANDSIGREDVEKPPVWRSYLRVAVRSEDSRDWLAQDIRKMDSRRKTWIVEVSCDQPDADVSMNWSQELALPNGARLVIEDMLTGRKVSMTQESGYRFRMNGQTSRTFKVTAESMVRSRVMISDLSVAPSRARGSYDVRYNLTGSALVNVQVTTVSGQAVARLNSGSRSAGSNSVTWNGRNEAGIALPSGAYLVNVTAVTEEGETVRRVAPVVISR